jgi:hypothetical protein
MKAHQVGIAVSSLTGEEIDADAFMAEVTKLAKEQGLAENAIQFEGEEPFPVEGATLILLTLASKVVYDVWKELILPKLKERYRIEERGSKG